MKLIRSILLCLIIFCICFIFSCCPNKLLNTLTSDSIRVEIRDRIVERIDTAYIEIPIEVEKVVVKDSISHLETIYASSDASIDKYGLLHHSLQNKPQKRSVEVKTEYIVRDSIITQVKEVVNTVEVERKLNGFQQFTMNGFWILLSILIIIVGIKLYPVIKKFI